MDFELNEDNKKKVLSMIQFHFWSYQYEFVWNTRNPAPNTTRNWLFNKFNLKILNLSQKTATKMKVLSVDTISFLRQDQPWYNSIGNLRNF